MSCPHCAAPATKKRTKKTVLDPKSWFFGTCRARQEASKTRNRKSWKLHRPYMDRLLKYPYFALLYWMREALMGLHTSVMDRRSGEELSRFWLP